MQDLNDVVDHAPFHPFQLVGKAGALPHQRQIDGNVCVRNKKQAVFENPGQQLRAESLPHALPLGCQAFGTVTISKHTNRSPPFATSHLLPYS